MRDRLTVRGTPHPTQSPMSSALQPPGAPPVSHSPTADKSYIPPAGFTKEMHRTKLIIKLYFFFFPMKFLNKSKRRRYILHFPLPTPPRCRS